MLDRFYWYWYTLRLSLCYTIDTLLRLEEIRNEKYYTFFLINEYIEYKFISFHLKLRASELVHHDVSFCYVTTVIPIRHRRSLRKTPPLVKATNAIVCPDTGTFSIVVNIKV